MLEIERFPDSIFEKRSKNFVKKGVNNRSYANNSFGLEELSSPIMPVDFASYLMSSSPPGFSLYNALSANGFTNYGAVPLKPILTNAKTTSTSSEEVTSPSRGNGPICVCFSCQSQSPAGTSLLDNHLLTDLVEDDDNSSSDDDDYLDDLSCDCRRLSLEDSTDNSETETYRAFVPPKRHQNKRVTFADCQGKSLTEVRIMTESSDTPPKLRPQILASLTDGALAGVTEIPPLKLDFPQPASDYYAFREKLHTQCVCLENVILKDYNVLGTIKVKNLSFQKAVLVRVSFDSWKTFTDVKANYVPSGDSAHHGPLQYDTFAFEIHVPSVLNRNQATEFCINYHCDLGDFWDNADGKNYRVVTMDYTDTNNTTSQCTPPRLPDLEPVWSEYSVWQMSNADVPYY